VFAHNEAANIVATLESISVVEEGITVRVVVVTNGHSILRIAFPAGAGFSFRSLDPRCLKNWVIYLLALPLHSEDQVAAGKELPN